MYAFLWSLIGWGLASWVIVLLTLPDPPPDAWGWFFKVSVAGILGGLAGGFIVRSLVSSDPMPGFLALTLVGAAAGASIVATGMALTRRASLAH
jgi:uncharacterized membrane protein YeaQ/YmgE (transglycosylase-associated protein family)